MTAVHVLALIGSAAVIYLACDWFVNAVEWLGVELGVGTTAIGTVLAAVGTALPESVVTLVAVLSGGATASAGKQIGVGAALGGPLVLATVAYAVVGVLLAARRGHEGAEPLAAVDVRRLVGDQAMFAAAATVALLLGLVDVAGKAATGLVFFAGYAWYLRRELRADEPGHPVEGLEPLRLARSAARPARVAVLTQTLVSLLVVVGASEVFVGQLEWAGPRLGLPAAAVALLLAPVATELPEIMNAVIWCRQGKTTLALANISGSMMVQATVPAGIGLVFTPWRYDAPLLAASLATVGAVGYLSLMLRVGRLRPAVLAGAAAFYAAFAVALGVQLG